MQNVRLVCIGHMREEKCLHNDAENLVLVTFRVVTLEYSNFCLWKVIHFKNRVSVHHIYEQFSKTFEKMSINDLWNIEKYVLLCKLYLWKKV